MTPHPGERRSAVVIGGGQAGLSASWYLSERGIDHVVLERDEPMHSWRDARWDSFCLVTPNFQCRLPGHPYAEGDPDGFMVKDELNDWLADWLEHGDFPVRSHTGVQSLRACPLGRGFDIRSSRGDIHTEQVIVATGGYHEPNLPRLAERLPERIVQVHSSHYRNPGQLPPGAVLVVGTGQSGSQIAEDLHRAGRQVHLAVGSAPRCARKYRGRDVIAWLEDMGQYAKPVTDRPVEERFQDRTNHYFSGRDGGKDIDLREFAREGMMLHGHLTAVLDGRLSFADDLGANLDHADAVYNGINRGIDEWIERRGIDVAGPPSVYEPQWRPEPGDPAELAVDEVAVDEVAVDDVAAVVWATGFRSDYRWLNAPVFDGAGHPIHLRGVTDVAGLYFVGLPWLHTWGSGRFAAVADDAEFVVAALAGSVSDSSSHPANDSGGDPAGDPDDPADRAAGRRPPARLCAAS